MATPLSNAAPRGLSLAMERATRNIGKAGWAISGSTGEVARHGRYSGPHSEISAKNVRLTGALSMDSGPKIRCGRWPDVHTSWVAPIV